MLMKFDKYKYLFMLIILTIILYIYHLNFVGISSDTTTMLPMAMDILNGNYTLRGWILGTNNFYFTDILFETLLLKIGLSYENIIYGLGSFDFALLITLLTYFEDKYLQNNESTHKFLYLMPFAIMIFPVMVGGYTLLNLHSHISAYVVTVICWILALKYLNTGLHRYVIIYLIVAILGVFSDAILKMVLFAPICLAMIISILLKKTIKYSTTVIFINIFAYGISNLILRAINKSNFYMHTIGLPVQVASHHLWGERFIGYVHELLKLYGCITYTGSNFPSALNNVLLSIFLCIVVLAIIYFVLNIKVNSTSINILLLVAIINACACIITNVDVFNRYIVPFYIFTMPLVIKFCSIVLDKNGISDKLGNIFKVSCIVLAGIILILRINIIPAGRYDAEAKAVASYLQSEHFSGGYGSYWESSLIWYYTGYSVPIYQVLIPKGAKQIEPFPFLVKNSWWNEKNKYFIILKDNTFIDKDTMVKILGKPIKTKQIGNYIIYSFDHDISKYIRH